MKTLTLVYSLLCLNAFALVPSAFATGDRSDRCSVGLVDAAELPDLNTVRIGLSRKAAEQLGRKDISLETLTEGIRNGVREPLRLLSDRHERFMVEYGGSEPKQAVLLVEFLWFASENQIMISGVRQVSGHQDRRLRHDFHWHTLFRTYRVRMGMTLRQFERLASERIGVADLEHAFLNPVLNVIAKSDDDGDFWLVGPARSGQLISIVFEPLRTHNFIKRADRFPAAGLPAFLKLTDLESDDRSPLLNVTEGPLKDREIRYGTGRDAIVTSTIGVTRRDVEVAFEKIQAVLPEKYRPNHYWFVTQVRDSVFVKVVFKLRTDGTLSILSVLNDAGAVAPFEHYLRNMKTRARAE